MSIDYSYGERRIWEMVPGVLVWLTLIMAVSLSFFAPTVAIVVIIVFDLYWLFRVLYFLIFLFLSWKKYRQTSAIDWQARLLQIKDQEKIHHLIFLPTYKESEEIIRTTLCSLTKTHFDQKRLWIVLAGEARDHERFSAVASTLEKEWKDQFGAFFITEHPSDLEDEIPGKGSNLHYAAKTVAPLIAQRFPHVKDEDIVVSAFDVDTIAHPQYFAHLTCLYKTVDRPTRTSYQPVALFSNNIWYAKAPVRVAAFGTTFWLLGELARVDRLWTFSSHSMPWVMLKDVGFWQRNIVSEDSRIFLQAFEHYDGDYRVTPVFLPVSMDTVTGSTYWQALVALYKQQRRWAWGVEHLPAMIEAFKKNPRISRRLKFKYIFNHIEGMYTWATAPLLIFILGWLPLHIAKDSGAALVSAAPFTLEKIMQGAMIGIFASAILALFVLPKRPKETSRFGWVVQLAQWALLPVTFVVFGAFPAIDAQTRLMLGKYLGFNVTKKNR